MEKREDNEITNKLSTMKKVILYEEKEEKEEWKKKN